ncbi:MAG: acetyl-CoA carboxylase biotin carboxyl carrier protein subunit [Alloprevotella sp.]|nr:acetyl-CoA carboxylase biotin carboxyl carrier protein subunit [Alloprevotella sp.]
MKQYTYKINGAAYDVCIDHIKGQTARLTVNGIPFEVEMQGAQLSENNLPEAPVAETSAPAQASPAPVAQTSKPAPQGAGEGTPVKAPLPGIVTKILVSVGQKVKRGENVLVLEAMKMENNIAAESDGTVSGIAVSAGDSVLEGTVLITIA